MNYLRIVLAETSAGLALGLVISLLLARWTGFGVNPAMAFNTGLMILAGAMAGLVWSLFAAASKERLVPLVAVIPVVCIITAFAVMGFDWDATMTVPGHLLGEAIGLPGMNPYGATALLGLAMLPALLLPLLVSSESS